MDHDPTPRKLYAIFDRGEAVPRKLVEYGPHQGIPEADREFLELWCYEGGPWEYAASLPEEAKSRGRTKNRS